MTLTQSDLQDLLFTACTAALEAGQFIQGFDRASLSISQKNQDGSAASQVVTQVDLYSQDIILRHLLPTLEKYDLALLTEETTDDRSRLEKDYFWCVDPLDGTLPFTEGIAGYSVSIALVSRTGVSTLGVVYDPVAQVLYQAVKGGGAFRNDNRLTVCPQAQTFSVFTDRSFEQESRFADVMSRLCELGDELGYTEFTIINKRGGVLNALGVVENSPAVYFKLPKYGKGGGGLWDFAASACIVSEAGGAVSDVYGQMLDLNRQESTYMNHRGVLYGSTSKLGEQTRTALQEYLTTPGAAIT